MSINIIDDVINVLKKLDTTENIGSILVPVTTDVEECVSKGYCFISTEKAIAFGLDDELLEDIDEIELSGSHFFLDQIGNIDKKVEAKLKKLGMEIIPLKRLTKLIGYEDKFYSHVIKTEKFMVPFTY